jgi:ribosome biogenesis protein UTP30
VDKLKKRYKAYEQKRSLAAEFDIFMVDDRVIKIVAECLGKSFYKTKSKRPIPIRLTAGAYIDRNAKKDAKEPLNIVGTPEGVAKEIESALNSTYLSMSPSANTSIKVGNLSMTPQQLVENTNAVVTELVNKHVGQGWRNIRSLNIKGPTTKALPIWLADELWADQDKVRDAPYHAAITENGEAKGKSAERKRKWDEWEEEMLDDEQLAAKKERQAAKKAKKTEKKPSISKEKRKAMKQDALQSVQTPLIAG